MFGIHLDVSQHCEIIASLNAREMSLQISRQDLSAARAFASSAAFFSSVNNLMPLSSRTGFSARQGTRLLVFCGQIARRNFARFDIGLIEGVDADDRAGNGSSNFPAEEFRSQIVNICHRNSNDWMAGFFDRGDFASLSQSGPGSSRR